MFFFIRYDEIHVKMNTLTIKIVVLTQFCICSYPRLEPLYRTSNLLFLKSEHEADSPFWAGKKGSPFFMSQELNVIVEERPKIDNRK